MYRRKALAGAALVAVLVPALAFADTSSDTQSQIQSLLSQIQTLQKQLMTLISSSGSFKPTGSGDDMRGIVSGKVTSVSSSSFVVQNSDGSKSVTVTVTASTTIQVFNASSSPQWQTGTMTDITVGRSVGVQGTKSSDGSINATMVKVGLIAAGDDKMHQLPLGQLGKELCIALNRNLGPGSQGDDVKSLQQMLAQDPSTGFNASATGVFGSLTAKAIMMFQKNNGITPSNDGSVGPQTRALFERRCGNGLGNGEGQGSGNNTGGGVGMMLPRNTVIGTVTANNGSTITIQNKDGNKTATVNIVASTTIEVAGVDGVPTRVGTSADLTVGSTVMIQGSQNGDGTYNAYHIRAGALPMPMNFSGMKSGQNGGQGGPQGGQGQQGQGSSNGWEWNQSQPGMMGGNGSGDH